MRDGLPRCGAGGGLALPLWSLYSDNQDERIAAFRLGKEGVARPSKARGGEAPDPTAAPSALTPVALRAPSVRADPAPFTRLDPTIPPPPSTSDSPLIRVQENWGRLRRCVNPLWRKSRGGTRVSMYLAWLCATGRQAHSPSRSFPPRRPARPASHPARVHPEECSRWRSSPRDRRPRRPGGRFFSATRRRSRGSPT